MKRLLLGVVVSAVVLVACAGPDSVTVYSGRSEELIGPLFEQFTAETGIQVDVKYDSSSNLALLIAEEGDRSPAEVFVSQSPGAVGFLAGEGLLQATPGSVLELVPDRFQNANGLWVGLSGRARVVVYNSDMVDVADLPTSVFDLTGERYRGEVGLAPANGSFQDFVTAMRSVHGDEATLAWLQGMADNDSPTYPKNSAIVDAVARGEIPFGLVNHYYNFRALAEDPSLPSLNHYLPGEDIGALIIVTAAAVPAAAGDAGAAEELIAFMLSPEAQDYFTTETFEYPLAAGAAPWEGLPPLEQIEITTYDFDELGGGLQRTKELIDESGFQSS